MTTPTLKLGRKISKGGQSNETNMPSTLIRPDGHKPPPATTYTNPRRTSPKNSITLRHRHIQQDAVKLGVVVPKVSILEALRRNSSDESSESGTSDTRRWYDQANLNIQSTLDLSMDADPPYFHEETEFSMGDGFMLPTQSPAYKYVQNRDIGMLGPGVAHSSSADDYRSVIDDLTIENKRLREELKRYKQLGPESLKRDKLFEVKVHGLPSRKKRELEAALRDFTASIDGSSTGPSVTRKKDNGRGPQDFAMSKHASSSSGSNSRPNQTDSAYASMSSGSGSSNPSLPTKLSRQRSDYIERQTSNVSERLMPRFTALTEMDKKTLVVRRLEQLFTGKTPGHTRHASLSLLPPVVSEDVEMSSEGNSAADRSETSPPAEVEPSREAYILPMTRESDSRYRHTISPSNSTENKADLRDTGGVSGSNSDTVCEEKVPEQRPTRPNDLDPDRASVAFDNMEYIRHLGLLPPEARRYSSENVSPDTEGWVYLNLLCSMAQLHMFNVTPDFIRSAVSEMSRQFQLSPDGRKIRWRGGDEGTKFISDNSGSDSQHEISSLGTDGSNENDQRKKQKTMSSLNDVAVSESSKFISQVSSSSGEFHYKPMFVRDQTSSSDEQLSVDETGSSVALPEDSNLGMLLKWHQSGEAGTTQRRRRRDGAIIYYTGAPFCTDLSGDCGEYWNSADCGELISSGQTTSNEPHLTASGSSIRSKPLSTYQPHRAMMDLEFALEDPTSDAAEEIEVVEADFPWSDSTQAAKLSNLEASGIGGITPDDHFVVVVSTKRPKTSTLEQPFKRPSFAKMASGENALSKDTTASLVGQLATIPTPSPPKKAVQKSKFEYVSGKVRQLPPAPLPPPSFFFGSASSSSDSISSD